MDGWVHTAGKTHSLEVFLDILDHVHYDVISVETCQLDSIMHFYTRLRGLE